MTRHGTRLVPRRERVKHMLSFQKEFFLSNTCQKALRVFCSNTDFPGASIFPSNRYQFSRKPSSQQTHTIFQETLYRYSTDRKFIGKYYPSTDLSEKGLWLPKQVTLDSETIPNLKVNNRRNKVQIEKSQIYQVSTSKTFLVFLDETIIKTNF